MQQAVAAIIRNSQGLFLMQKRDNKPTIPCPGEWTIFGGGVDEGETPEQAMKRELHEEIGVNLDVTLWARVIYDAVELYIYEADLGQENITLGEGEGYGFFTQNGLQNINITWTCKWIFNQYPKKPQDLTRINR